MIGIRVFLSALGGAIANQGSSIPNSSSTYVCYGVAILLIAIASF